jgi:hypothetical protein
LRAPTHPPWDSQPTFGDTLQPTVKTNRDTLQHGVSWSTKQASSHPHQALQLAKVVVFPTLLRQTTNPADGTGTLENNCDKSDGFLYETQQQQQQQFATSFTKCPNQRLSLP